MMMLAIGITQQEQPINQVESTLKEVLELLYNNATDLSRLTTQEVEQAREIARRCPLDDGFGVYIARAALLKIDTLPIPYSSDCERVSSAKEIAEKQKLEEEDGFQVYPNPASDAIFIEYNLERLEQGTVNLYGITGNLLRSEQLVAEINKLEIDLSKLSSGMYILAVEVDGEQKLSERISVIRP